MLECSFVLLVLAMEMLSVPLHFSMIQSENF
jgi:hypothetical protein